MEALHIIGEEHQSLAAILHAVRYMLKQVQAGQLQPDLKLFQAMIHYLDAYAEKRHHPKEDIVFKVLSERTEEGAEALARLAVQHDAAPRRIEVLQRALDAYMADPSTLAHFARAFENYAEFYRGHMVLEEEVALPLLRKHLTAEDWEKVNREFRAEHEAWSGKDAGHEDFAAAFSKLVESAPAPLGFGKPYAE